MGTHSLTEKLKQEIKKITAYLANESKSLNPRLVLQASLTDKIKAFIDADALSKEQKSNFQLPWVSVDTLMRQAGFSKK